jgi:hypothetical protein
MTHTPPAHSLDDDDSIDFAEIFARLRRGLVLTAGLTLVGLAAGTLVAIALASRQPTVTTLRVTFGFPGFERGTYPNGTKFQADDVRAPDIINEALKRLGIPTESSPLASRIRGAIGISGFVSQNIVKERDKLRAGGQVVPPYFPDEYEISLSLPRGEALSVRQRELLLAEIINVYLEKFRRSYVQLPPEFGNAFASLQNADFVEYELILTKELQTLSAYLEQKIDTASDGDENRDGRARAGAAKQFRSPTNNLSFQDLLRQSELFAQLQLNDVLSQIYVHGLSKNRSYAMVKMDYYLRTLEDQEQRLKQEEAVVTALLERTQERAQNYVLATKAQNPQGNQPLMDQGFIDSLLANDAYNYLVRRALEAGLAVKRVQAEKARLLERRQRMESFATDREVDQAAAVAATQKSLVTLEGVYEELLAKVRTVLDDYARQEYADAIRISMQAKTDSILRPVALGAVIGLVTGLALGAGLSLLRNPSRPARA